MYLKKLNLLNFKNYLQADLKFSESINCFVGDNGGGKTNLLDAIFYLSFCKSFINPLDSQNITHGKKFFLIQGLFESEGREEQIICSLKQGGKKQFKRNKKEYPRLADHIGLLPVVMISPEDVNLIHEGSEMRRKFLDSLISQMDKNYLDNLINYNRILMQRNALLKSFALKKQFEKDALSVWDEQLLEFGSAIFRVRKTFVESFVPAFQKNHRYITGTDEEATLEYQSQLHENEFKWLLKNARDKDRALQYTSVGVHKDDLVFKIGGHPIKKFGSQGQQKSYVISLKLTQFDFLKTFRNFPPILLLDDIFDKLDALRVQKLMELVSQGSFGQIFITHTYEKRLEEILKNIHAEFAVFRIVKGVTSL